MPAAMPAQRPISRTLVPPARLRKGWCPGALRPMAAKDGLIVRLRLTGGIVPTPMALAVADLAERFGNGRLDLSGRSNLQLRGVREAAWPALLDALRALALVDGDAAAEAVRNVMASPLAGVCDGLDIRPLVAALEAALVADVGLHRLPTKFLFLIDDGAQPSLGSVPADVRFDWLPDQNVFSIGLGGSRAGAVRIGICGDDQLVARACGMAASAIAQFERHPDIRRVKSAIGWLGAEAVAAAFGGEMREPLEPRPDIPRAGPREFGGRPVLGLAVPFGRLDATMLRLAATHASGELRLTPWRTILLPHVVASEAVLTSFRANGFVLDPDDARLRVDACVGRDGCVNATTPTHADASALAELAPAGGLHVSGCEKGCARAAPAPITLVGRDGRYDLVRKGRAGDAPVTRGLDLAAVRDILAAGRTA